MRNAINPALDVAAPETLIQFLNRAPLGLVQATLAGAIESINPTAAELLAPVSFSGRLENLFAALEQVAPRLRDMVANFGHESGSVCGTIQLPIPGRPGAQTKSLFIDIFKLDGARLIATLSDKSSGPAQQRAARRSAMENELSQALADNQLFVQYQPLVSLSEEDGAPSARERIAGVEALVRWNHRIRGAVSPLEFIGVAEECGLSGALGGFVLRSACRQFMQWQNELGDRAPKILAVNLSRGQLTEPGFAASVSEILESSGMIPEQLQLEVHESLAAHDASVQRRLRELKTLGLVLALDNFGSGYSSLASLHLLPVDLIKIDRSFINEAVLSAHHRVLIDATVRVAKSLRMAVAAEGIETEAQLAVARQLGCQSGQGYFFSEAISAANLSLWLTTG